MPDLDVGSGFGFGSDAARVGAAILFLQASTNAMDVFSAVNSSPWTAENFGGDQAKSASVREYVWHGIGLTVFYIAGASILAVGYILPLIYLLLSLKFGPIAGPNPFNAKGLEWTIPSPPTTHNFETTPIVDEDPYEYEIQEGPSV